MPYICLNGVFNKQRRGINAGVGFTEIRGKYPRKIYKFNPSRLSDAYMHQKTIIGLENGLSPRRHQAIIWTNAGVLIIGPFGTKFQWNIYRNVYIFWQYDVFENVVWKMAAILSRTQCVKSFSITWGNRKWSHANSTCSIQTKMATFCTRHFRIRFFATIVFVLSEISQATSHYVNQKWQVKLRKYLSLFKYAWRKLSNWLQSMMT